jgi:hypothetical protein
MTTPLEFSAALLDYMGVPRTQNRLVGLVAFAAIEGGHWHDSAKHNPFNTMYPAPGAVQAPGLLTGIKSYPDWPTGIAATAHTIGQSNMKPIADALRNDVDPQSFLAAITQSAWCPGCNYTPFNAQALYNSHANEQDGQADLAVSSGVTPTWKVIAGGLLIIGAAGGAAWYVKKHGLKLPRLF